MKKSIIFLFVAFMTIMLPSCNYNRIIRQQETVEMSWSEVENQYQRRMDLIPNLVSTVKGYASHEQETLTGVIEARAKATSVTIDANNMTEEQLANYQKAQRDVTNALSKLMMVTESYPQLRANENFLELQAQLEGTENRISVARRNFNKSVRQYNNTIRSFPTLIYAGWFGFTTKPYFQADEGAKTAPKVEF